MKKLFVSVPMKGRTKEAIKASIAKMHKIAEIYEGEELTLINSYVENDPPADSKQAIWYLGKSIEAMSAADIFIGIDDYYNWHGCRIETDTALSYNVKRYTVDAYAIIENYNEVLENNLKTIEGVC
jgi:hypothetical protein